MIHESGTWRRQNIPQLADVFRVYAARVVLFEKPFQPRWRIVRIISET
jgi:hypothetical protein